MQGPDGRPNGIAFVLFDGPDEASKAIGQSIIGSLATVDLIFLL